jgi:hydroxyacylglutathione hydrolase
VPQDAAPLEIVTVPCRTDNYAYLLRDAATGATGVIDAPEAGPIAAAAEERGWGLDWVWITHHHDDHVAGVAALRDRFGAKVLGAQADSSRLPALDAAVAPGDVARLGDSAATVIDVSGHTVGHVAFHFAEAGAAFTADSLFRLGCGRVFEGTHLMMWESLSRLAALPEATTVWFGHEYTEANLRFAETVEPDNAALAEEAAAIRALREAGRPTTPTTIGRERAANPFLRSAEPALQDALGLQGADAAGVFAEIRRRKDAF